jgi:hypothetical protein
MLNGVVNVGNSLLALDDHERYFRSRLAALWAGLRIQDISDEDPGVLQHDLRLLAYFAGGLDDPSIVDFAHASLEHLQALLAGPLSKDRIDHYENEQGQ